MEEEKDAFFVVRKGDVVGVYKSFSDCEAQVGSSVNCCGGYSSFFYCCYSYYGLCSMCLGMVLATYFLCFFLSALNCLA